MKTAPTPKRIRRLQAKPEDEGLRRCGTRYISRELKRFADFHQQRIEILAPYIGQNDIENSQVKLTVKAPGNGKSLLTVPGL